jgi:hypothetical protein
VRQSAFDAPYSALIICSVHACPDNCRKTISPALKESGRSIAFQPHTRVGAALFLKPMLDSAKIARLMPGETFPLSYVSTHVNARHPRLGPAPNVSCRTAQRVVGSSLVLLQIMYLNARPFESGQE